MKKIVLAVLLLAGVVPGARYSAFCQSAEEIDLPKNVFVVKTGNYEVCSHDTVFITAYCGPKEKFVTPPEMPGVTTLRLQITDGNGHLRQPGEIEWIFIIQRPYAIPISVKVKNPKKRPRVLLTASFKIKKARHQLAKKDD